MDLEEPRVPGARACVEGGKTEDHSTHKAFLTGLRSLNLIPRGPWRAIEGLMGGMGC